MAPYKRPTSERSLIERAPLLTRGLIRHLRCVSYRAPEFTAIVCSPISLQLVILPQYRDARLAFPKRKLKFIEQPPLVGYFNQPI